MLISEIAKKMSLLAPCDRDFSKFTGGEKEEIEAIINAIENRAECEGDEFRLMEGKIKC